MISIKCTGICQDCPEVDLYIEKFHTDMDASLQFCFCEHQAACNRAWDLGFKEGLKSEKEDVLDQVNKKREQKGRISLFDFYVAIGIVEDTDLERQRHPEWTMTGWTKDRGFHEFTAE